ncbi:MAG: undecaprenyldiphospho-muramoylpentapeptide beta-N-acetylglucosaminyltransferase [Bacteroidota bacterium]|nr:undecaprenyldiphospho-muramoylpentapeptide beta-N-acetylglucosaminyltransferase [Bacteroidota bacterium]
MGSLHNVLISGGGTGGHIHPALAIADEIKRRNPDADVRFVGALGRMEMDKVPAAGYDIDGLWISGIERKLTSARNLTFPFKLLSSLWKARRLLRKHCPQVVVGVGGFASGPLLDQAVRKGLPTLIQEQNSFPGITNRLLSKRVDRICAGLPGLERWFPEDRIVLTGNPLRSHVCDLANTSSEHQHAALAHWGFTDERPVVFVMGGSLGAQSMNEAVQAILGKLPRLSERGYQVLWQCGGRHARSCQAWLDAHPCDGVVCAGFIDRMDLAYQAATIIASRAGAMSIAELALVGKAAILVPSPNVAEDHQTHNAQSLTELGGALLLPDASVREQLGHRLRELLDNPGQCEAMAKAMQQAARPNAAAAVVDQLEQLV